MDFDGLYQASMGPIARSQELSRDCEGITPSSPTTEDLEIALSNIREELRLGVQVVFRMVIHGRSRALRPLILDKAYRIRREALLNAFCHSEASRVEVDFEYAPTRLRIAVRDNGKGITPELFRSGRCGHRGLSGMRDLAERMGAKLRLLSRVAAGTEVELSIPGHIAFASQTNARRFGRAHV